MESSNNDHDYVRDSTLLPSGFHGDMYLLNLVDFLIKDCKYFIETGTNIGSTLAYVAREYPKVKCLSCEPEISAYNNAINNTKRLKNVSIFNETSQVFIKRLNKIDEKIFNEKVLFWLDAHGIGFNWPLKEEISFITYNFESAYILIDDFKVPKLDCFGFDTYQGQICSYEYIKSSINSKIEHIVCYPNYSDITSDFHPLRGWGLILYGKFINKTFPEILKDKIQKE